MLVSARIITGFLLLVLITGELSNVYRVQGGDNAAGKCDSIAGLEKEALPEGAIRTTNENKIGGRKMALREYDVVKMAKMEQEAQEKTPKKPRILISRENYGARFVAFNADYRGPRHHPPKNH